MKFKKNNKFVIPSHFIDLVSWMKLTDSQVLNNQFHKQNKSLISLAKFSQQQKPAEGAIEPLITGRIIHKKMLRPSCAFKCWGFS